MEGYNLKKNIDYLYKQFNKIKNLNWIKSSRQGTDAIGRTFEQLLGQEENNLEIPDFYGIEIKTKRSNSKSYINLFNMTPMGNHYHEIKRIRDSYGYLDTKSKKYKVLNNSVFCNKRTSVGIYYQFMLKVDKENKKIFLCVFNISGYLLEKVVYWDFNTLKEKLYRKLSILSFIKAHRKYINGVEYFKYYDMNVFVLKDFDTFISLIESGLIRVTFKVSVFRSGIRCGQIHDHGTSFEIKECDLLKLYNKY